MSRKKHYTDPATKTPWNPSKRAMARVTNPLPAPETCRFCGSDVEIARNSRVYGGREYGDWPWIYVCTGCEAYVGMHPFTNIPLGTLADQATRDARKRSKPAFERLWLSVGAPFTRKEAYAALAERLGIAPKECHFGWFDVEMCERARRASLELWDEALMEASR